jgi:periplasmic copper chaperone A
MKKTFRILSFCFLTFLALLLTVGCSPRIPDDAPYLVLQDAWAKTAVSAAESSTAKADAWKTPVGPMGLGPNGMVFMVINNQGGAPDTLLKAESDVAETVELQQMVIVGNVASSYKLASIAVPARTALELKSGSYYVRLINLKKEIKDGQSFKVKLTFEKSGTKEIEVTARNN